MIKTLQSVEGGFHFTYPFMSADVDLSMEKQGGNQPVHLLCFLALILDLKRTYCVTL